MVMAGCTLRAGPRPVDLQLCEHVNMLRRLMHTDVGAVLSRKQLRAALGDGSARQAEADTPLLLKMAAGCRAGGHSGAAARLTNRPAGKELYGRQPRQPDRGWVCWALLLQAIRCGRGSQVLHLTPPGTALAILAHKWRMLVYLLGLMAAG